MSALLRLVDADLHEVRVERLLDGSVHTLTWPDLRDAAGDANAEDIRVHYAPILREAEGLLARRIEAGRLHAAWAGVRACDGHRVASTGPDRCFSGPVSRDENRAAHGNISYDERCRCGAVRSVNVNGLHVETGPWGAR